MCEPSPGWAAVLCQLRNCWLQSVELILLESPIADLTPTQTADSSRARSCRNPIKAICRFDCICERVASLTCWLQWYCNTASNTNTAASTGAAPHRKSRTLVAGFIPESVLTQ